MDWSLIPDFLAVARAGTLAGAAKARRVNHSTMYRRLNQLEATLETRLFERLPDGYQLTEGGERLRPFAEAMEAQALAAERSLTGIDRSLLGEVRLTAPENLAYDYLPVYLAEFRARYPDIRVTILVSNTELDLDRREADVALRATPQPPEHLVGRRVLDVEWGVFAAPAFLARHGSPTDLGDLSGFDWVVPEASLYHLPAAAWIRQHISDERVVARGSTLNTLSRMAEAGLGLTVLPHDQVKPTLVHVMAFPPGGASGFWLLTHPDLRHTGRIKVLIDFLAEALRAEPRLRTPADGS
ncbi:MAG: LysR family transcriptional regulator [Sedimenticolaceae bacterium]